MASSGKTVRSVRGNPKNRNVAAEKVLSATSSGKIVGGVRLLELSARAATVADAVGGQNVLATLLEVNRSQPSQWIRGAEQPSPGNAKNIVELDYVIARIKLLWAPAMVGSWLTAQNAFLEGARPVDVLRLEGSRRVIEALDAEASGVFA